MDKSADCRVVADPTGLVGPIREFLRRKDRTIPLAEPATTASIVDDAIADFRAVTLALAWFSAVALGLALVGLYGVLEYHVSQRRHELGGRMALGASGSNLISLVLARGLALVAIGLVVGTAGTFVATRALQTLLDETAPTEPATFVTVPILFGLIIVIACLLPAWRAARVNPADALRAEQLRNRPSLHAHAALEIRDRAVDRAEPMRRARGDHNHIALGHRARHTILESLASYDVGIGRRGRRWVERPTGDERRGSLDDVVDLRAERMDDRVLRFASSSSTPHGDAGRDRDGRPGGGIGGNGGREALADIRRAHVRGGRHARILRQKRQAQGRKHDEHDAQWSHLQSPSTIPSFESMPPARSPRIATPRSRPWITATETPRHGDPERTRSTATRRVGWRRRPASA